MPEWRTVGDGPEPEWVQARRADVMFDLSRPLLLELARDGVIRTRKKGRKWGGLRLFSAVDIRRWIAGLPSGLEGVGGELAVAEREAEREAEG